MENTSKSYHVYFCSKFLTKRYLFLTAVCLLTTLTILYSFTLRSVQIKLLNVSGHYAVYTTGCKIPDFYPFHPSVQNIVNKNTWLKCRNIYPPIVNIHNHTLSINEAILQEYLFPFCQYTPIYLDQEGIIPNKYRYGKPVKFKDSITVSEEYIKVECFSINDLDAMNLIYENFFSLVIMKDNVEKIKEPLALKYKQIYKEQLSVVLLVLDSMSRLNFIRKLPLSYEFLKTSIGAIEFKGFNKVGDGTFTCMIPLLTGKYVEELPWNASMYKEPFDHYNLIWKNFSAQGYRTMIAEEPGTNLFPYFVDGFYFQPSDYYFKVLEQAVYNSSLYKKSDRHCLGSKLLFDYLFEWLHDFSNGLNDKPLFSYVHASRLLHDYLHLFGNADKPLLKLLNKMHNNNIFQNTVLFLFGDHGLRFGDLRQTFIGRLEERLPALFVVLPPWFQSKYPKHFENLKSNMDKLTTAFDVYKTLIDILKFDGKIKSAKQSVRGISFFQTIPDSRTCEEASILPHWCTCHETKNVSTTDGIVIKASLFSVEKINELLTSGMGLCAVLNLSSILKASISLSNEKILQYSDTMSVDYKNDRTYTFTGGTHFVKDYLIVFTTSPNNAVFESTVRYLEKEKTFILTEEISRVNKYGSQSDCVDNPLLKKYCFCSNNGAP